MSNKAVTQMTDPEYTVEFDGKETYVTMALSLLFGTMIDGCQSKPVLQFLTSSKTGGVGLR
jgi:hypothetical protein